jgi:hypothetical protein
LGSATGWAPDEGAGTSERPASQNAVGPLRNVGDICTCEGLGVVDVSLGTSFVYDFGPVTQASVGVYRVTSQVIVAGAEPLSTRKMMEFDLWEESAGVFDIGERNAIDTDIATDTTIVAVEDATLDGAGPDSETTFFVANADDVTDAAAWDSPVTLRQGNLYLVHGIADRRRFTLQRIA